MKTLVDKDYERKKLKCIKIATEAKIKSWLTHSPDKNWMQRLDGFTRNQDVETEGMTESKLYL